MRKDRATVIGCVALVVAAAACSKKLTASGIDESPAAIAQKGDVGTSTWIVGSNGAVSATLKGPDGKPIAGAVTGSVAFAPPGAPPASVPVHYDPSSGVLTAAGPTLDADVTPVSYALAVDGKPWNGSIAVPRGGTQELASNAKLQGGLPPGLRGPNGGLVQIVGPDRVELVANKSTGDVRAYVLDPDNRPVDPGDRKVTILVQGESPEVLALEPEPEAHFVVGHLRTHMDPAHVTIAINAHGATHACLVGWSPGSVVLVGPRAPRVHLFATEGWPGEVVELRGHGRHHGDITVVEPGFAVGGPEVVVGVPGVVVGGPSVVVGGPSVVVGGPGVLLGGHGSIGGDVSLGHEHERGHDQDRDHDHGRGGNGGGHRGH